MSERIGFIGLGIMGQPMALNLLAAGHRLRVFNRTAEKTAPLVEAGALACSSPGECSAESDVVITIVTDSPDVEEVLYGESGAVEGAAPGTTFIDMSTISPAVTRSLASRLEAGGHSFLDAPVSGGDVGARAGTLTIMIGGRPEVFARMQTVFQAMGSRVTHVGPAGAGQVTKACNQILCGVHMIALCEALSLAERSGIDLEAMHRVVTGGAGNSWALEHLGRAIIDGDFSPGFMVRLIQKDLSIVLAEARELGLPLAGTALAQQYFRSCEAHGEEEAGTQAMFHVLERLGNFSRGGHGLPDPGGE